MNCIMEYLGKRCGKPATWRVWFLNIDRYVPKAQKYHYFCDDCVQKIAKYDAETGNRMNGEPIGTSP